MKIFRAREKLRENAFKARKENKVNKPNEVKKKKR